MAVVGFVFVELLSLFMLLQSGCLVYEIAQDFTNLAFILNISVYLLLSVFIHTHLQFSEVIM